MLNKILPLVLVLVSCALTTACAPDPETDTETETADGSQFARYQVDDDVLEVEIDPRRERIDLWLIGGGSEVLTVSLTGADTDAEALDAFREAVPSKLLGAFPAPDQTGRAPIDAVVANLLSADY